MNTLYSSIQVFTHTNLRGRATIPAYKRLFLVSLLFVSISPVFASSMTANVGNCNVTTFSGIVLPVQTDNPTPPINAPQLIIESATVVNSATLGQYCDVIGHIHTEKPHQVIPAENAAASEKEVQIEVKLPTIWNTKYLQYGGGGFDGSIAASNVPGFGFNVTTTNSPLSATYSPDGAYAISATDGGHSGGAAAFLNSDGTQNVQRWLNYSYQSRHLLAQASKSMIQQYYGAAPTFSYHGGVSKGALSGIVAAARYPNDFDGIIALAPVIEPGALISGLLKIIQLQYPGPCTASTLSACLATQVVPTAGPNNVLPLIASATMAKCDPEDGLVDGVISNPQNCSFDVLVDVPTCASEPSPTCMTMAQKNVFKAMYSDSLYPRFLPGYESDPGRAIAALTLGGTPSTTRSSSYVIGEDATRYLIYHNLSLTAQSINLTQYDPYINNSLDCSGGPCSLFDINAMYDSINGASLSAFKLTGGTHGTGGKLLVFHGLADPFVNPMRTIAWYEELEKNMGGLANTRSFARLFLMSGRTHSSAITGTAAGTPSNIEVVQGLNTGFQHALENWVENGVAPDSLLGENTLPSPITRPICAYPYKDVYIGPAGDTAAMKVASNFKCSYYNPTDFLLLRDPPNMNIIKAGFIIPMIFIMEGNYGNKILANSTPSPSSVPIDCSTQVSLGGELATTSLLNSGLLNDHNGYLYAWTTSKSWKGTCRQFILRMNEGTLIKANFNFN